MWGDQDPSKVHIGKQLMTELDRYVPQSMIPLYSPQGILFIISHYVQLLTIYVDWKQRISEMHATLKGRSMEEAKAIYPSLLPTYYILMTNYTYMQHVMKWPLYGSTLFTAKANAGIYGNNTDLYIDINQEGIYVLARKYVFLLCNVISTNRLV